MIGFGSCYYWLNGWYFRYLVQAIGKWCRCAGFAFNLNVFSSLLRCDLFENFHLDASSFSFGCSDDLKLLSFCQSFCMNGCLTSGFCTCS